MLGLTALNFAAIALIVRPPGDITFPPPGLISYAPGKVLLREMAYVLRAFSTSPGIALALFALIPIWLFERSRLGLFIGGCIALATFSGLTYANWWHSGFIFVLVVYCTWTGYNRAPRKQTEPILWGGRLAIAILLGIHIYYGARSWIYDYRLPYSGSVAAVRFIAERRAAGAGVYGHGFRSVALEPYFQSNLFAKNSCDAPPGFWLWSAKRAQAAAPKLTTVESAALVLIIVGPAEEVETMPDAYQLASKYAASGFRIAGVFPGHSVFYGREMDEESYFVLERENQSAAP